jgi:hypothetical protein
MKHSLQTLAQSTIDAVSELRESVSELKDQERDQMLSKFTGLLAQRRAPERRVRFVSCIPEHFNSILVVLFCWESFQLKKGVVLVASRHSRDVHGNIQHAR